MHVEAVEITGGIARDALSCMSFASQESVYKHLVRVSDTD